jgi:hypothetical protein
MEGERLWGWLEGFERGIRVRSMDLELSGTDHAVALLVGEKSTGMANVKQEGRISANVSIHRSSYRTHAL